MQLWQQEERRKEGSLLGDYRKVERVQPQSLHFFFCGHKHSGSILNGTRLERRYGALQVKGVSPTQRVVRHEHSPLLITSLSWQRQGDSQQHNFKTV